MVAGWRFVFTSHEKTDSSFDARVAAISEERKKKRKKKRTQSERSIAAKTIYSALQRDALHLRRLVFYTTGTLLLRTTTFGPVFALVKWSISAK